MAKLAQKDQHSTQSVDSEKSIEKKIEKNRVRSLRFMMVLVFLYMLAELIVGFIGRSLALVSDSFHMLSDFIALVIGVYATKATNKPANERNTYGYLRAETLGGLINGVFLLGLCLNIFLEAVQRLFETEEMRKPELVLYVGIGGLLINILGLFMMGHDHGHSHHGHSHHGHSHTHEHHGHHDCHGNHENHDEHDQKGKKHQKRSATMHGVFLHILGDFLGSIVVLISAAVVTFTDWKYKDYVDPVCSIIITGIIVFATIPTVKETTAILMQRTPEGFNPSDVKDALIKIDGVMSAHHLHAWILLNQKVMGSVSLVIDPEFLEQANANSFNRIVYDARCVLHKHGVHNVCVQIEAWGREVPADFCQIEGCCDNREVICCPGHSQTPISVEKSLDACPKMCSESHRHRIMKTDRTTDEPIESASTEDVLIHENDS